MSRIIMTTKPNMTPHAPHEWSSALLAGSNSSATTKIMEPAANANNHGCNTRNNVANNSTITAEKGYTKALHTPYKNALFLLFNAVCIGNVTAAPSGKF